MTEITVNLPWPPSVNRIWRCGRGRTYRDPRYLSWIKEAGWLAKAAKPRKVFGKFKIEITLIPPDRRHRDADNVVKAILDLLQSLELIENDSLCRQLVVSMQDPGSIPGACVQVSSMT